MVTTVSHHQAITSASSPLLRHIKVPGVDLTLTVHRDYAPVFAALARDYHDTVAHLRIHPLECWSYAYRQANMASGVSDHAGWAIDLNSAHEGAQGSWGGMRTMSLAQKVACRELARAYGSVLYWGGSTAWGGQYRYASNWDPMHWYVRPYCTPAAAKALMIKLGIDKDGNRDMPLNDADKAWIKSVIKDQIDAAKKDIAEEVWQRTVKNPADGETVKMGAVNLTTYNMVKSLSKDA